MDQSILLDEAKKALSIIYKKNLSESEQDQIMTQTIQYWKDHINEGFLAYRKSVANGQAYAFLDWADPYQGSSWFIDHRGQKYLDLLGGYGIYNVGRRHPKIIEAVQTQLSKQALHSQELLDPLRSYCAHLLSMIAPRDHKRVLRKCFFTNSGTESVEACLKLSFLHTGRKKVLAVINAFHGKTLGSLACTYKETFRGPFKNVLYHTTHIPLNDIPTLEKVFEESGKDFACFMMEPIQGEGGIYVSQKAYLQRARELCDQYGVVLVFDEVQSGMGRTGKWWSCQHFDVCPDLMAIGKAFGGGIMPVGACIGTDEVWQKYVEQPFVLTTTFGGNPLALSASIATINVILEENIISETAVKGELFMLGLKRISEKYPKILKDVRGIGMMIGIEFGENRFGVEFSKEMFSNHVLVAGTLANAQTIRVEPALTITVDEIMYVLEICERVVQRLHLHHFKPQQPVLKSKL
jgi:putrescine aminotransferase